MNQADHDDMIAAYQVACNELYSVTAHMQNIVEAFTAFGFPDYAETFEKGFNATVGWHEKAVREYSRLVHERKIAALEN